MGKSVWKQELQYLATPLKYLLFSIGVFISFVGLVAFVIASADMANASKYEMSLSDYAIAGGVCGALPFISGIALCVFAERKRLKKWWDSRKDKSKRSGTEIGNEKPVDPVTAALNRRTNRIANVGAIVTVIIGIVVLLKLSNWLAGLIGIPSAWILPIFMLPLVVGAMLSRLFYKKKFSKTVQRITDKIVQKMLKDKR